MSLLFDANLSPRLVTRLRDIFPTSRHVQEIGLTTPDNMVWRFALENNLAIVTKDDDFRSIALLVAPPGKVILLSLGNCDTNSVESLFRNDRSQITDFLSSGTETLLVIP